MERLAATSQVLKTHFPEIYRDFFGKCQRVASASNSFLWTGEFSGFYGGITVSQKLPIRSYVGFEVTFDGKVIVESNYQTFDVEKQKFVSATVDARLRENLAHYIEEFQADEPDFTGLKVHLLTEIPLGHSLGSNGAIAAALALLLDDSHDFESVFTRSREILALSQAGHSSGVTAYMALTDHQSPVVFTTDSAEEQTYSATPISELAGLKSLPVWPIDFGIIYSGVQTNAESVILANQQTVAELEADTTKLHTLLKTKQKLNFRHTYTEMLNMTAHLTVLSFVELFTQGSNDASLEQLFNSLNQFQNLLHILHISNSSTDLVYSRIHQIANKQINDVGSGVKISGIGKGGAVLFAVPYGTHRTALIELVDKLRKETGRAIWLDYASWIDGIGGEAGIIEQDITAGVNSSFIDRDTFSLTILNQGKLQQQLLTNERFEEFAATVDLLLDKTTGKIMISGQPVTSKQLVSQKATITILSDLIQSKKFVIKNDKLPASYGSSRYDLQGKIVMPLIKCVKEITDRDLQLSISGGMYDEYELSLNPSNIVIAVVESKS